MFRSRPVPWSIRFRVWLTNISPCIGVLLLLFTLPLGQRVLNISVLILVRVTSCLVIFDSFGRQ